jgi:serine/threonine protein kinase
MDEETKGGIVVPGIPGYRISQVLGEGGMATVYLGIQEKLKRKVAIKVMNPYLLKDPSFSKRFLREAETAANLNHTNIISIIDVGQSGQSHYIVMEYLPQSLKNKIKESPPGRLSPSTALKITREIAAALEYAHNQGFVHRDIKPENIMFRQDGTSVLADFGIARAVDSTTRLTRTGISVGTPNYMSPEQCRAEKVDGRSDLYALGIVLFEMLTGSLPYEAASEAGILLKQIQAPIPRLPAGLTPYQSLIDTLLAKDMGKRPQRAGELIAMIGAVETGETLREEAAEDRLTIVDKTVIDSPPPSRWRARLLAASIAIVIGVVVFISLLNQKQTPPPSSQTNAPKTQKVEKEGQQPEVTEEKEPVQTETKTNKEKGKEEPKQKIFNERPAVKKKQEPPAQKAEEKTEIAEPLKTVETVNIFAIPSDLRREYYEKIKRIEIPNLPEGIWVSDQVSLNLAVDDMGKLFILDIHDKYLTVKPENHKEDIRQMIEQGLQRLTLPPPHDKEGLTVRVKSWRLNFKAAAFHGKIVLELIR